MEPVKFSIVSKAKPTNKRSAPDKKQDGVDYVTSISGSVIVSAEPAKLTKDGPYVIPLAAQGHTKRTKPTTQEKIKVEKKEEEYQKNEGDKKEIERKEGDAPKSLDELAVEELINDAKNVQNPETALRTVPLTVQNQIEGMEDLSDDEERFKFDLQSRPEQANEEEYESMPIDEFGFAMLRGMGWAPGAQIGLNNRGLAEPIEFVKRPGYRLGLGATPKDLPVKKKKYIKPGESRDPPPIMVAPTGPDGKVRHVKNISEKLVPLKKGLQAGQLVGIVSGPHEGLYARVVNAGDEDDIEVRLESSSENLIVSKSDVSVVDLSKLSEGHPALKFMIKAKREKDRERDEREEKDSEAYHKKDHKKSSKSSSSESSSSSSSWIRPRIMVRVVSKSFLNGKYYNKKVRIYDVVGRNECTIQLDNGALVEGVKQRMLETVVPQAGGKVMVVEGINKGKVGKLIERTKKGNTESAIVQMIGDLSIETFSLDDVAQYVGTHEEEAVDMDV